MTYTKKEQLNTEGLQMKKEFYYLIKHFDDDALDCIFTT